MSKLHKAIAFVCVSTVAAVSTLGLSGCDRASSWFGQGIRIERHGQPTVGLKELYRLPTPSTPVALAWSRDGTRLAAAVFYGVSLIVWDKDNNVISQFNRPGHIYPFPSLAFVDGSSELFDFDYKSTGDETAKSKESLAFYDVASGKFARFGPSTDFAFDHFDVSADQTTFVGTYLGPYKDKLDWRLALFRLDTLAPLMSVRLPFQGSSVAISKSGRFIAAGIVTDGIVEAVNSKTGEVMKLEFPDSKLCGASIEAVAVSADDSLVFGGAGLSCSLREVYVPGSGWTLSPKGGVQVWRITDGARIAAFDAAWPPIRQAVWDPKNRFVAFVDSFSHVFLWQPTAMSGTYIEAMLPAQGMTLAISPDGRRLAVGSEKGVTVFSINE